jgi:soluble lytic murein transglycosylase-like protein
MKQFIRGVFLLLALLVPQFSAQAQKADTLEYAKYFATHWVSSLNTKASRDDINRIVEVAFEQGVKHRIDPLLLLSMIKKESTFNKNAKNKRSPASGLLQIIPYWHRDKINGRNIFKVSVNIEVGARVLRDCLDRNSQDVNRALTCYSGGGDKRYVPTVKRYHKQAQRWVVENQFLNQLPVYYAQASNDRFLF